MPVNIGRRELIAALGSAVAWPLAARAQQGDRMRRVGVLMGSAQDDPQGQARVSAFAQGLQQLGWSDGRNVRIDIRWSAENIADTRKLAAEVVALAPDVILASGSPAVGALQQTTRTVPIVFATAGDPVGAGFVDSLSRPGGNITGFAVFEYTIGGEMAGAAQRDFAAHDARGGPPRSGRSSRARPVRRDPDRCVIVWGGGECDQRARARPRSSVLSRRSHGPRMAA